MCFHCLVNRTMTKKIEAAKIIRGKQKLLKPKAVKIL